MISIISLGRFDIIGEVEDQRSTIKIKDPCGIQITQTQKGYGVSLVPPHPLAKPPKELVIDKMHVILNLEANDEVAEVYQTQMGKVVTPPSSIVTP